MALNLANLWRTYKQILPYVSPAAAVYKAASSPKSVKRIRDFVWGVNDTLNYPAVAIWELWAHLSPKGSKAEYYFNDWTNNARETSDLGQDRTSAVYLWGRLAPALAVYWGLPAWGSVEALWTPAVMWLETAWLWTMWAYLGGDVEDAYNWQRAGNGQYVNRPQTSLIWRKVYTTAPTVQTTAKQPVKITASSTKQEAKRLITNELRRLSAAWELLNNVSRTQKLINLYKKLK